MKKELLNSVKPSYLVAVLLLAALALLAACGDDDGGDADSSPTGSGESTRTPAGTPVTSPAGSPGLPVECTAGEGQRGLLADLEFSGDDGLFDEGEDVEMTLTLINCGDNEVRLSFPTTKRFEVSIEDEAGLEVWNSSDNKAFDQVIGEQLIASGDTVVYVETWEQEDSRGEQVPPGTYRVSALSVGCGQEEATDCKFGPIRLLEVVE